jgi:hypothetical protein
VANEDPSLAIAASTTWQLIADFTNLQDEPREFMCVNYSASVGIAEILVDPLHAAARVATGTVPGTSVEGVPLLNNSIPMSFFVRGAGVRRVFARSTGGATIGFGPLGM